MTDPGDSGDGTLRRAIEVTNSTVGTPDLITFTAPMTITPLSPLPPITDPVTIDGTSVATASGPGVVIDGSSAGADASGLVISGAPGSSTIRALRVVRFAQHGILVSGTSDALIQGNYVGTDGVADQGNAAAGVTVRNASRVTVDGNVISGNGLAPGVEPCCGAGFGVQITGASSSGNVVTGNRIGTGAVGTTAIGNGTYGITIGSPGNIVGGDTAAERNVISGNGRGVQLVGPDARDNVITGNYIGTDLAGTGAVPNEVHGILLNSSGLGNRIGGTASGEGNVIGPNGSAGILISASSQATVQGNSLGVAADGATALPGSTIGVHINGGDVVADTFPADDNLIGGTDPAAGNLIANQLQDGVRIQNNATGNRVQRNRISANGNLGIDLMPAGVTANDAGDGDTGPNRLQNFPLITGAGRSSVSGTIDVAPGASYRIEIYQNTSCDPTGNGEGETFLASVDGSGPTWAATAAPVLGTFLTAIATDTTTGDTSEFGPCYEVIEGGPPAGIWQGEASFETDTFVAAGNSPAGPAQFTYDHPDPDGDPDTGDGESASWDFFTTVASSGPITLDYRWTGFHGFAGVTAKLTAAHVVGDGGDRAVVLVDEGPASCTNPGCEGNSPSAAFDYAGRHTFDTTAGDVIGFTLEASNGDTNENFSGEFLVGIAPTSCADAQDMYGATTDGRYVIEPAGGQRFSVHCLGMDTESGEDYLTVPSGPGINTGQYAAGGLAEGETVTTSFSKLRFDPATLTVDIGDRTFATSTGGLTHPDFTFGNTEVTSMSYATAMACGAEGSASANVNLRGTPFAIDDTWTLGGTGATGTFEYGFVVVPGEVFVPDPQVGNITGNGSCGWNSPNPRAFNPFNPTGGDFSLQLRYLNESPTPPAPVLFRAIPNATNDTTGVVGRLNAVPGDYAVRLYASTTCDNGVLGGEPVFLGPASVVIGADDQTYFSQLVTHTLSTRRYVALSAVKDGAESELSPCIVAQADNDVWPRAAALGRGTPPGGVAGWIDQPGSGRWYKIDVDPGAQLTINLTDLPADYDLFLFKDIQAAYDEQAALDDTDDLTKLSAEFAAASIAPQGYAPQAYAPQGYAPQAYAPQAYAPEEYAPQAYAPQGYAPQAYAPQGYAPQAYAPQGYAPQAYAPQAYAPQGYAPQAYAPDIFLPEAYAAAQVTTLVAIAAHTGTGAETIIANTWNNAGDFYIRVSGKNGASSIDQPFQLNVAMQSNICAGIATDSEPPLPVSEAADTLILTDPGRMPSTTPGNSATDKANLSARLTAFAEEVDGVVVDLARDTGVVAMNAQADRMVACPFAKNLVAQEIKDVVDLYRATHPGTLKYVVLVGDDNVIPFFRYADQALLGPEQDFVPPVDPATSSEASLRSNYVLGQDEYGASMTLSHGFGTLPIPELPVGRLVETAADATLALDGFLALTEGVVPTPKSSLVTGYDFIADASTEIRSELTSGIGSGPGTRHDELMTPFGISPLDPTSWTADQLRQQLATRHDLLFLGGHFSADSALAADFSTSITTADLATVDLENAIVFSIGCHSGYNTIDSHSIPGVTQPLDWAQAIARKKATLIAGTGYQYGDTDFVEYSERIYLEFARELRRGTGAVSVGDALVRSKQTYLRRTDDLRGLHEKSLLESAIYGLPMVSVDMPGDRLPASTAEESIVDPPVVYGTDPAATLGLASDDASVDFILDQETKTLKVYGGTTPTIDATWYEGSDGVVTHQGEPALPLEVSDVSVPDKVLRGVLWLGGDYTEESVVPLTGAPATETRGMHTRFASPVFYPIRPWSVNYTGALTSEGGSTELLVTPAQHKGSPTSDEATLRTYASMDLRLFYSDYTGEAALSAPPEISTVSAAANGDQVTFEARVTGNPAAGVQEAWILYTAGPAAGGTGSWIPVQLEQDQNDTTLWRATETIAGGSSVRYLAQAVNGLGLVTMSDNYGEYYAVGVAGAQPQPPAPTTLQLSGPASGVHARNASFTATLRQGTAPLAGKPVVVSVAGIARTGTTDADGTASISVPLLVGPGTYQVAASFTGDLSAAPSSAHASVSVQKAPTSLALSPIASPLTYGTSPTVTATLSTDGTPLAFKTVAFVETPASGPARITTAQTDFAGQARLTLATSTVGINTLAVRFGSVVTQSVDLTSNLYDASQATASYQVHWPFTGFLAPVNNLPTVNVVKAGNAVPVKFSLGGDRGLAIFQPDYPRFVAVDCASAAPSDEIEATVAANSSGLQYDPTSGHYTYVWKTPKKVGCYRLDLALADGTVRSALFRLR